MRGLIWVICLWSASVSAQGVPVVVDVAQVQSVQSTTALTARVVARETVLIPAETSETVRLVRARIGDRVNAGDVLATLEAENARLKVETLEAREAYLQNTLELLTEQEALRLGQVERAATLNTRDLLTRDAKEQAELNWLQVKSSRVKTAFDLKDVQLQLADARRLLKLTVVTAKRTGRVIAASVSEGQYVKTGDTLFEILPDDGLELDAEVRADAFNALEIGQTLTASLRDASVEVQVRALLAEENPRTGGRSVRLSLPQSVSAPLIVGEAVTLQVPLGSRSDLVTVSKDAIMPTATGHRVVVIVDGKAEPRAVQLGAALPGRIGIMQGISAGEQVVIQGQEGLRKGQAVEIVGTNP